MSQSWQPRGTSGIAKKSGTIVAEVMRNDDPLKSGRLLVYNADSGADPSNPDNWLLARYMSPYYGIQPLQYTTQEPNLTQNYPVRESYGWWMTPPDVGVKVVIVFLNDVRSDAVWIGCLPEIGSHGAIPAQDKGDFDISVGEIKSQFSNNPDSVERPDHSTRPQYLQQGIANDNLRGTVTSSSLRESPSRVFGFNTPGSHSFVMDDGDETGSNKLFRLRSGAGNQIMMNDDSGLIHIINRDGTGWIELSPTGQIDVYGASGINLATTGNINMHADRDIKMHAGNSVQIVGEVSTKVQGSQDLMLAGNTLKATGNRNVDIYSDGGVAVRAGSDFAVNATNVVMRGTCFKWNSGGARQAQCVPLENAGNKSGYRTTVIRAPSQEPYNEHDNGSRSSETFSEPGVETTNEQSSQPTTQTNNTLLTGEEISAATEIAGAIVRTNSDVVPAPLMNSETIEQDIEQYSKQYRTMGLQLFYLSYGPAILEAVGLFLGGTEGRRIARFLNTIQEKIIEQSSENAPLNSNPPRTSIQVASLTENFIPEEFVKNSRNVEVLTQSLKKTVDIPLISEISETVNSITDVVNNVVSSPIGSTVKNVADTAGALFGANRSPVDIASNISGQAFSALQDIANSSVGNSLLGSSGLGGTGGVTRGCGSATARGSLTSGATQQPASGNRSVDGLVDTASVAELEADPAWQAKISEMERKYPGLSRDQIYRVIQGESSFNLKAKNPRGSATGFFQFVEDTANDLGYTTGQIQNMSAVEQLQVYDEYLAFYNYRGGPLGIMQAAPAYANAPGNAVIYRRGQEEYTANREAWDPNNTGVMTVDSINRYYGY